MNALRFDSTATAAWAAFSGDYNPIHFDPAFARSTIGTDGTVVHGMLAMLALKQAVSERPWAGDGWLQWTGMLKQAMPSQLDYAVHLSAPEADAKVRFRLHSPADAEKRILGNCAPVAFDTAPYRTPPRHVLDAAAVSERLQGFADAFPAATSCWVAIDALIFAEYIQRHSIDTFREDIVQHFGAEMEIDLGKASLLTMQTHHRCIFRTALLQDVGHFTFDRIAYDIRKIDEITTHDSLFATIDIPVWLNDTLSQVVQIGLMARKKPALPQEEAEL